MSNIIVAEAKTVKAILGEKYAVDFYQREYKWQAKQAVELVDDLLSVFLPQVEDGHDCGAVLGYRGYFLGSIIVSGRDGKNYLVDGQQRLTTLTLLVMSMYNKVTDLDQRCQLADLIRSRQAGRKTFNLDVPDREECLTALYDGKPFDEERKGESICNLVWRHREIDEKMGGQDAQVLPLFADWLIERVCLVEIRATSDEDAYTVFETMNDRGLSLTPTEMLKGYLLAKINDSNIRNNAGDVWKEHIGTLVDYGKEEDSDAIKAWLRGKYAENIRERRRNAVPQDFDRIGSEFHRWVRDKENALGLGTDVGIERFITAEFAFYAGWYLRLRRAADDLATARQDGLENVYYNAESNFTLQFPVLLSSLNPDDSDRVALPKLCAVSAYLDILIHRRFWSGSAIDYSTMSYAMFLLMRRLRDKNADKIAEFLQSQLGDPSMSTAPFSENPRFYLHGNNKPKVRRILARMATYLEENTGKSSRYTDYVKCEVEHIWADKYIAPSAKFDDSIVGFQEFRDRSAEFNNEVDFDEFRNRIGGLLLLPKKVNASLKDMPYGDGKDDKSKLSKYLQQNQLAQSLHPDFYKNNPEFRDFVQENDLPFKSHPQFKKNDLEERQALYLQLAERIWNSDRIRRAVES